MMRWVKNFPVKTQIVDSSEFYQKVKSSLQWYSFIVIVIVLEKYKTLSKFSIQLTINKAASNFTQENTWRHITWQRGNTSPENLNFQHKSRSFATLLYNFDQNQIIGIWNRVKRFPNCPMSTNCLKDLINSWIKWEKPQTPVDLETVLQPGDEVGSQVGPHSTTSLRAGGI